MREDDPPTPPGAIEDEEMTELLRSSFDLLSESAAPLPALSDEELVARVREIAADPNAETSTGWIL
jgi:hypothetical protein